MNRPFPFNIRYLPHIVIAVCIGCTIVGFLIYYSELGAMRNWVYLVVGVIFSLVAFSLVVAKETLELGESYRVATWVSAVTTGLFFMLGME